MTSQAATPIRTRPDRRRKADTEPYSFSDRAREGFVVVDRGNLSC